MKHTTTKAISSLRDRIHIVIEGTDTRMGKLFDIIVMFAIVTSVAVVMLDSVLYMRLKYSEILFYTEWFFTILFTIEYVLRIFSTPNRLRYAFSFFGVVDLLSLLPTYLSLFLGGVQYITVVRILRILRVFRVLKLASYMKQASFLAAAMSGSKQKIFVFFLFVLLLVTVFGSILYVIEGPENGFTSIPISIYWAIVTLTTVGYGDISPKTPLGQVVASMIMIVGYSVIAVPTGIFTSELSKNMRPQLHPLTCSNCGKYGHATGANFCDRCGNELHF